MSKYHWICITGTDRVGKETATTLLQRVLTPSRRVSYPSYGEHWSAAIMQATLREQEISVCPLGQPPLTFRPTKKPPEVFQMLQSINRLDQQAELREALKTQHILCDRWALDARIYGAIDGCNPEWLAAMDALYHPADLNIVLVGKPFPRAGEEPDINERDGEFQGKVRQAYEAHALENPGTCKLINVDDCRCEDPIASIRWVHREICGALWARRGLRVTPIEYEEIAALFPHLKAP